MLPRYARMAGLECETEPSKERAMFRTVLNPGDNAVPRIGTVMPDGTIYAGSTTPAPTAVRIACIERCTAVRNAPLAFSIRCHRSAT